MLIAVEKDSQMRKEAIIRGTLMDIRLVRRKRSIQVNLQKEVIIIGSEGGRKDMKELGYEKANQGSSIEKGDRKKDKSKKLSERLTRLRKYTIYGGKYGRGRRTIEAR